MLLLFVFVFFVGQQGLRRGLLKVSPSFSFRIFFWVFVVDIV
jgi:hypothetical protein